ncbi:hypothetical protein LSH36_40g13027 [Paralvinella palmiformis]|uniref:Uncharacterized protein n=1 Tax=Paralvinella palmiformis TaxID=53620 RepID=A0AAD9K7P7_9ANNE|nr:hypothetical protein LSH36_40g13027 [Paralvinella palmiformis]
MATRRGSVSTRDSSDHGQGAAPPISLSQAHRRTSRIETNFTAHAARRMSVYRRPSLAGSQRTDLSHPVVGIPMKLQNTYRMYPEEEERFSSSRVAKMLSGLLASFLDGEKYEAIKCTALSQSLSDVVKGRMKEMDYPRYKFVCLVLIGEKANQAIRAASRCVWNTDTDNFAEATYENDSLFAVASVYGCYFE